MEKYSILMSVYYKEQPEYLLNSIESVFAQTVVPDDFVLVCDGPLTPELDSVIYQMEQKYGEALNVIRFDKNRGLGPALNDGIKLCKNRLVARMDSDDITPKNRCELQLKKFAENPELSLIGGAIEEFACSIDNIISKKGMPLNNDEILMYAKKRCPFNHPTVMFDKNVVLNLGGYPDFPFHEDYCLWATLLQNGVLTANLPETLCYMRVDSGLYGRRGGLKYLKVAIKFRWHLYKTGFVSLFQAFFVMFILTAVCIVPTPVRKLFYTKILRKKQP